ncbi:MAG: transcriptional regulator [Massilia sp.]|jgi:putative transcriptional regulator|nr:transcriptional regulator [Massilia sp.]MDB5949166.1 transcriptional regulator [Massilia sp.]
MTKRDIFAELMGGFDALDAAREGKVTLKRYKVEHKPAPKMTAEAVKAVRAKLRVSQPVFARQLRTEPRTVANWEQGVSQPNAQATILLKLVDLHPELLKDIAAF